MEVKFGSHVDIVKINLSELEQKLADMVKLLNKPYPGHNEDCEKCSYHNGRGKAMDIDYENFG